MKSVYCRFYPRAMILMRYPLQAQAFEQLVPSWWCCLKRLWTDSALLYELCSCGEEFDRFQPHAIFIYALCFCLQLKMHRLNLLLPLPFLLLVAISSFHDGILYLWNFKPQANSFLRKFLLALCLITVIAMRLIHLATLKF